MITIRAKKEKVHLANQHEKIVKRLIQQKLLFF